MNVVKSPGLLVVLVFGLCVRPAFSGEASVKILSPAEGAKLVASARNKITYDVTPGPRGDHTHLYVDGAEAAVLRKLKGDYDLKPLARGLAVRHPEIRYKLAWVMLLGWAVQAASGAGFGAVSFLYYGELPDIHGIAIAALVIKIACAAGGFLLAAVYVRAAARWAA